MTTAKTARPATLLDDILVQRVMHVGFVGCPFETPLTSVAQLMARCRVHSIVCFGGPAERDTQLWGLASDLDVVCALATGDEAITAGEIAATEVVTVSPRDSVSRAVELLRTHEISHLLVVEPGSDRPLGIISTLDILALAGGAALSETPLDHLAPWA